MADASTLKKVACDAIDAAAGELHTLSQEIWEHPELNFQEKHAHAVLTDFLEKHGFPVSRHFVVDTGFKAEWGEGKPCVSVLCEYDALPEIGHACGHNLIAEVGAGAGLGIKAALEAASKAGKSLGKCVVIGTPAEEGGGGKYDMVQAGVFSSTDISMMCHPTNATKLSALILCNCQVSVTYHGKASHAAGSPWDGVNALDAAVMAYQAISNLRQQCKPTWRIHGVISNGGAKPNIIPEESKLEYYVRAPTMSELNVFKEKVTACFNAAAIATGCTVDIEWHPKPYANMITNTIMADLFEKNAESVGVSFEESKKKEMPSGSTDMGNVSYEVPSIHPMFYIGTDEFNHTRGFTTAAGDPKAQPYTLQQAKALAMTAIDVLCDPKLLPAIKEQFQKDLKEQT